MFLVLFTECHQAKKALTNMFIQTVVEKVYFLTMGRKLAHKKVP